ncbi:hypothetical protein [Shinella oryzae]|uniref:Lipoprotein n=1 Tax=Shinella oryzae TaxID=2871820 RepID=A0ABY9K3E9_9HYPH|nr:hypothetical protein [Shinella oryzae]WLS03117.1 hypothetical protein Q9315_00270 [Shinella oryzae]
MKFRHLVVALAAASITSCAKRPDAIVPADIPMAAYTGQSCASLSTELAKEKAALHAVSKQQNDAASGDAFGVFLIGVPMSSTFGGDKEGQVAVAKGKVQAIENAMKSKGCGATGGKI